MLFIFLSISYKLLFRYHLKFLPYDIFTSNYSGTSRKVIVCIFIYFYYPLIIDKIQKVVFLSIADVIDYHFFLISIKENILLIPMQYLNCMMCICLLYYCTYIDI